MAATEAAASDSAKIRFLFICSPSSICADEHCTEPGSLLDAEAHRPLSHRSGYRAPPVTLAWASVLSPDRRRESRQTHGSAGLGKGAAHGVVRSERTCAAAPDLDRPVPDGVRAPTSQVHETRPRTAVGGCAFLPL